MFADCRIATVHHISTFAGVIGGAEVEKQYAVRTGLIMPNLRKNDQSEARRDFLALFPTFVTISGVS